jgi:hypothetical protein
VFIEGAPMPLPRDYDSAASYPVIPAAQQREEYWVRPSGNAWIIARDGDEYGPYKSRRDAMLFAVDAAHKLGEHGRDAVVRLVDATDRPVAVWVHGEDPYPPILFLDVP